ncbi:MAG: MFS transporter, partial [Promicromonosporaceae bacterium]|nr:MFS transporter [Promicromonosporaceae bacterium]
MGITGFDDDGIDTGLTASERLGLEEPGTTGLGVGEPVDSGGSGLAGRTWFVLILFGLIGQIAWIVVNMYFPVFMFRTITGDPNLIAWMVATSAVVATLTALLMGTYSDRIGRRKPFIAYGYLIWGIIIATFSLVNLNFVERVFPFGNVVLATAILLIVWTCVMTFFGSTANDAAFNAWVTDTTNSGNRGRAEGFLSTAPLLAMLIVFGAFDGMTRNDQWGTVFIIIGGIVSVCGALGIFVIRDPRYIAVEQTDVWYGFRPSVIRANPDLYKVLFFFFFFCSGPPGFFSFFFIFIHVFFLLSS